MQQLMHQLDPRTKLALVVAISTLSIVVTSVLWQLGLLLTSLMLLLLAGIGPARVFTRLRRFVILFVTLLLIQSIFSPAGEPLLTVGSVHLITTGGILKGVSVILRMLTIVSSAMLLTTSKPMDLVHGLIRLKIPYEIAFMVLLAMRFLPVLVEEVRDVLTAIQLRGVKLKKIPLGQKVRVYTYIFMPVVVSALLKAKKTAVAMEARAFRAYEKRTYLDELTLNRADYAVMTVALLAGCGLGTIYVLGR